jgi:hypothetical protein
MIPKIFQYLAIACGLAAVSFFTQAKKEKNEGETDKQQRYKRFGIISIIGGVISLAICITLILTLPVQVVHKTKTAEIAEPQINFTVDDFPQTEANQKIIQDVYAHFTERVLGGGKVESVEIIARYYKPFLYLYRQEDYGWINEIEIIIKIARDDKTIYERQPLMGNNLFYYFGGGKRPGMAIRKDLSAYFYGFKKDMIVPGEETFVDDNFYKIIDELSLE